MLETLNLVHTGSHLASSPPSEIVLVFVRFVEKGTEPQICHPFMDL